MDRTRITQILRTKPGRQRLVGIVVGVLGIVVVGTLATLGGTADRPWNSFARFASPSEFDADALKKLERALATEVQAREELAVHIAELEVKISNLQLTIDDFDEASLVENESPFEVPDSEEVGRDGALPPSGSGVEASKFDNEGLLSLGVHPRDVDRLNERWVSHQLETVSISHQALREGWFQQERHRAELIASEVALREELQDADYDRYLYALGKPNRLMAGEVLAGSSASEAGLRRGDTILRYDDVRVFKPGDLLFASSGGESGSSVPLDILRDGRRETLYIRRGPLGTLLERSRAEPLRE